MPDITRRRNSEDDNILEDEEEAAEDEAAFDFDFAALNALFLIYFNLF